MADEKDDAVFHKNMQCFVVKLEYDFKKKIGVLYLEDRSCTDMSGCIKFFKQVDPNVVAIQTIAGKREDTFYILVDGEWQAKAGHKRRE